MLSKDRTILRNLLLVLVGSTAAVLAIGVTCLGRGQPDASIRSERPGAAARPPVAGVEMPERGSVRSSAGGVTSDPAPVGTTTLTSEDLDRGASATGTPTAAVPGPFLTEPPPWAARTMTATPEAGARPLVTDPSNGR